MEILATGTAAWKRGFDRSEMITARSMAAIELLMLEQEGVTLTADTTGQVTKDPLTGKAFIFDPVSRELNVLDHEEQGEDPIKLPW